MTAADLRRTVAFEARRVLQTPRTFANWPEVLSALARSKVGAGPETLTFHTRAGQQITIPNAPGARVPAYEVFAEDTYDLAWFLGDLADRPIHALDVGAHVGTFACWFAAVHPTATLDCFEPSADTSQFLQANVTANGLDERVHVHVAALAGESGFATFDVQGAASGHNHLAFGESIEGRSAQVRTVTFDEVVAGARGPVELVKMDCEGGEYDLVYRSSPSSWANVQRLVLEYHDVEGQRWEELRAWFAGIGLHVLRDHRFTPEGLGMAWLSRTPIDDPPGGPPRSAVGKVAYEARRVAQTPVAFTNWPELLTGMLRERLGRGGPDSLTFATRSGLRLTTPNVPGARLPAYEQFAEDGYRVRWFLGSLLERPLHAIDVGAHVGTFACHLAQVHPQATITCFEPSASTAAQLRDNLAANDLDGRVSVVEAALTGESGWALFDDHGDASVHSGLVHDGRSAVGEAAKVPTLSFDDVVAAAPAPIVFVKLDCEGGEYEMAYRSDPAGWATVERVVLEYHDIPGQSWAELRAWFASVGLHLVGQRSERTDLGTAWLARGPLD